MQHVVVSESLNFYSSVEVFGLLVVVVSSILVVFRLYRTHSREKRLVLEPDGGKQMDALQSSHSDESVAFASSTMNPDRDLDQSLVSPLSLPFNVSSISSVSPHALPITPKTPQLLSFLHSTSLLADPVPSSTKPKKRNILRMDVLQDLKVVRNYNVLESLFSSYPRRFDGLESLRWVWVNFSEVLSALA